MMNTDFVGIFAIVEFAWILLDFVDFTNVEKDFGYKFCEVLGFAHLQPKTRMKLKNENFVETIMAVCLLSIPFLHFWIDLFFPSQNKIRYKYF